jgi:hypothetical protein
MGLQKLIQRLGSLFIVQREAVPTHQVNDGTLDRVVLVLEVLDMSDVFEIDVNLLRNRSRRHHRLYEAIAEKFHRARNFLSYLTIGIFLLAACLTA